MARIAGLGAGGMSANRKHENSREAVAYIDVWIAVMQCLAPDSCIVIRDNELAWKPITDRLSVIGCAGAIKEKICGCHLQPEKSE